MKIAAATVAELDDIIHGLIIGSINDVESFVVIVSFLRLYSIYTYIIFLFIRIYD